MPNWTKEQLEAIGDRGSNLLVAAAAGSGKTAVLVERIIQLITEGKIDIDKLLIVTFTNAAAGEMRERIANALLKEMEKKDENEEHIRRQITLLNRASITTIHSFCIDVVRKYFHLIDIDPAFRIGDTHETNILKLEAIDELFEREYKKGDKGFFDLVECFGGNREDTQLQELIEKIYFFIQSQPKPLKWLKEHTEAFNIEVENLNELPWAKYLKHSIEMQIKGAEDLLKDAQKICLKPCGPEGYLNAIQNDLLLVANITDLLKQDIRILYREMINLDFVNIGRVTKDTNQELKEQAKDLRDKAKDIIKGIKESVFSRSPEDCVDDIKSLFPLMQYLVNLIEDFSRGYMEKKLEKGIVDFNDLEHYALDILEHEGVSKEYRDRFAFIFVDEYQDSNIVQETLINHIKRENNLFMVGDVKQSIYRFRLADPTLFINKYESFSPQKGEINRKIDLSKNFRSREDIIRGVNFLFKNIMSKQLGEIDYNEEAYLYAGGAFEPISDTAIELNIIEKSYEQFEESLDEELQELNDIEVEAKLVAQRIKRLLNTEIFDGKKSIFRKVGFKDIVILMRTTQNWSHIFLETLIKENISAYADVGSGYFESIEISILINLLKTIDNKRQDMPLLSVMRSPIGGFSLDELVEIRIKDKSSSYFEAMKSFANNEENNVELRGKLSAFIKKLEQWAQEARYTKISEFLWKLFRETDYYYYAGAMPGGMQRQANLRVLLDRATQFEQSSIRGLFNFIKFVERLQGSKSDMGDAKILGENDDVVRIMSIHKSKGLEFPIVILAGAGKNFNLRDTNANVLLHKDLGIGPKYVDLRLRTYRDTIIKIAMKDKLKMESLSEEMRILYVALTRPIDKLIIYGSVKNLKKQVEKWCRPINGYLIASARSYIDWLGIVLTKHSGVDSLRKMLDIDVSVEELLEDESNWTCNILSRNEVETNKKLEDYSRSKIKDLLLNYDKETNGFSNEITRRLSWTYAYESAINIPSKLSVSEIKSVNIEHRDGMGYSIPPLIIKPKFLISNKVYTQAEKGTILHFIMQHLDFKAIGKGEEIDLQIEELINKEFLNKEEVAEIDLNKVRSFFSSPLAKRMLASNKIYREISFNMKRNASEVIGGLKEGNESLLVQGTIDCFFEEEDYLVLVDYKSDEVLDINNIVEKYQMQLSLYKEALERILRKEVKESYIYLFDIDKEVLLKDS